MYVPSKTALRRHVSVLAISVVFTLPFGATAQVDDATDATEETGLALDTVTVTARKREQNLQDVPVVVQTFTEDDLREKGLRDFQDYAKELTSVSFGTSSPGATTIAFRGALAQPTGFDTISSSVLYLDEIPITRDGQNPDVRLIDIERIEALSGPQPTIYGAGSQSGTLKIVTNKPNFDGLNGYYEVGLSTTEGGEESYDISGAVNIPVIEDKLAVRLVGFYEYEGGYIDNILGTTSAYSDRSGDRDNAEFVEDDINDYTGSGARVSVLYAPNPDWTITGGLVYQTSELDSLFDFNPAFGDLNTIKFKDEKRVDDWYNISLTAEGDLGFADLTIASGYHSRNIDYDVDSTAYMTAYRDNALNNLGVAPGTSVFPTFVTEYAQCGYPYYYCFYNGYDFGPNPTGTIKLDQQVRSFVQEIRLASKTDDDSKFDWLVGAFYERTDNDWDYISIVDDLDEFGSANDGFYNYYGVAPTEVWFDQGFREGLTYNGLPGNEYNGYRGDLESFAIFGELTYHLTEKLSVTGGGRWFSTDYRINENSLYLDTPFDNFDNTETTEDFALRLNATYEPTENILTYFTYSEGIRIGGPNGTSITPLQQSVIPPTFDGDKLINYEAGIKSTLFNGRMIANATAFMMDWEDYQIQADFPNGVGSAILNADNASIDGFEAQIAFLAAEGLELSGALTYIDAQNDEDVEIRDGNGDLVAVGSFAGDPLPGVPELKWSAGIQYTTPLNFGTGLEAFSRFDYSYTGESVNGTSASVSNFGPSVTLPQDQPEYDIGDFSFGINSESGWSVWAGINNVWDERAVTYIWPRFSDNRIFTVRPREVRVGLYKSF